MSLVKSKSPKINVREERAINAMQALGDKTRFSMFKLLLSDKEMCVSEIANTLDVSVPAISQHFRIFELVGLVDRCRVGQKICYQLKTNDPFVKQLIKVI